MFRRSVVCRGHQLIAEPLSGQEHNTFARGEMTFGNMTKDLMVHCGMAGAGLGLGAMGWYMSSSAAVQSITADGKINRAE
jgi:hypothetical protein